MCLMFADLFFPLLLFKCLGIRQEEIPAIRAAFLAMVEPVDVHITMVVAQTQHNVQVVPDVVPECGGQENKRNVPSGTCVDDNRVLLYNDGVVVDSKKQPFAFFLVPHSSPKGTAKCGKMCFLFW